MTGQEPAYRQVLNLLRSLILSGELKPGDKLPSVRELAKRYRVPVGSAARVIAELRAEGRVVSRHGSGVYVRDSRPIRRSSPSRLARSRWGSGQPIQDADTRARTRTVDVEVGEQPAPDWVAAALRVDPQTPVVYRRRRIAVDDCYVQLATSYLPVDLVRGTAITYTDSGPGGIYARLAETGHGPVMFREELKCRMPDPDEVKQLNLLEGTPVIEIARYAFQADGRCVEVNHMILDARSYVLDFTFPAESTSFTEV